MHEQINITNSISRANNCFEHTEDKNNCLEPVNAFNHSCCICKEDQSFPLLITKCKHMYDEKCFSQWVKSIAYRDVSCAVCRDKDIFPLIMVFKHDDAIKMNSNATQVGKDNYLTSFSLITFIIQHGTMKEIKHIFNEASKHNKLIEKYKDDIESCLYGKQPIDILDLAIKAGNINAILYMITNGSDPRHKDEEGNTYLHLIENREVAQLFIKEYPELLSVCNSRGDTPIHTSIDRGLDDITELFIENYHDVSNILNIAFEKKAIDIIYKLVEKGVDTNILMKNIFHFAHKVKNDSNFLFLKDIIKNLNIDVNFKDKDTGNTLLHESGGLSYNFVEFLIDNRADINTQNNEMNTPLHAYISDSSFAVISLLITKGANCNLANNQKQTVLDLAIQQEDYKLLEYIKKHCNINIDINKYIKTDQQVFNYAKHAMDTGNITLLEPLIPLKATNNSTGNSLLHEIKHTTENSKNFIAIINLLLEKSNDINSQNNNGDTPLHFHLKRGSASIIINKLIGEVENINLINHKGETVLDLAFQAKDYAFFDALVDCKAKFNSTLQNIDIFSYVERLCFNDSSERMAPFLISSLKDNLNIQQMETGNTLLHAAKTSYIIVKSIISNGADINIQNNEGNTPLHLRILQGNLFLAEYLIENHADFNLANKDGKTALDLATELKHNRILIAINKANKFPN
jgi:ankyrin repeat protein